jgi:arginine utilization protein RocB
MSGCSEDYVRALAVRLVRSPSANGTPDEVHFAPFLRDLLLAELLYFRRHPEHLRVEPVPGDPLGRSNVFALVRGGGARTVLLCGHYDVVPTAGYGGLAPWACDPGEPLPRTIACLQEVERGAEEERC